MYLDITVNCRGRRPRSDFPDFSGFFGRFSAPGGVRGHPGAGGFHHRRREPVATLPDPVRGRNRVFGRFRTPIWQINRPQCCCCRHQQAPMWLLHTSTGPIVLLYNSNSPCVATTHSCVATTHSLCGFHTETGVRVRVRCGSGSGRHAAKSGAAGLHTRTQDRFPALRGEKR